jgi:hypothetical protein
LLTTMSDAVIKYSSLLACLCKSKSQKTVLKLLAR